MWESTEWVATHCNCMGRTHRLDHTGVPPLREAEAAVAPREVRLPISSALAVADWGSEEDQLSVLAPMELEGPR